MSDTTTQPSPPAPPLPSLGPTVTTAPPAPPPALEAAAAAVMEAEPAVMTEAVAASQAAPAPASAQDQQLAQHEGLLNSLLDRAHEFAAFMERAGPLLALVEQAATTAAPQAGAVVARLGALEGFALDLVTALDSHFSGKLTLPEPPKA